MNGRYLYLKIFLSAAMICLLALLLYKSGYFNSFGCSKIRICIHSFGKFAAAAYILVFSLRTLLVFFPYSVMVMLGGSLFGPFWGFLYSMISVFISASLAFYLGRFLRKDAVRKILGGRLKLMDSKLEKHGFKVLLLMRISALFPFDAVNYAAGLTRMKYRDFILATVLGVTVETFSYAYLGENLKNPFSWRSILAVLLVLLTVALPFAYGRVRKKYGQRGGTAAAMEIERQESNENRPR